MRDERNDPDETFEAVYAYDPDAKTWKKIMDRAWVYVPDPESEEVFGAGGTAFVVYPHSGYYTIKGELAEGLTDIRNMVKQPPLLMRSGKGGWAIHDPEVLYVTSVTSAATNPRVVELTVCDLAYCDYMLRKRR